MPFAIVTGLVAVLHTYFCVLEMFLWTKPVGLKAFRQTLEKAQESQVLAANQGLYNGFLVAGLVWGFLYPDPVVGRHIHVFFLACVTVAGLYGGYSVGPKLFFIQAAPALVALALAYFFPVMAVV